MVNKEFKQVYAKRAGIEGTISQAVRTMGMRRSRYIGQEKTHLQHIATTAALNVVRSMAWFSELPRALLGWFHSSRGSYSLELYLGSVGLLIGSFSCESHLLFPEKSLWDDFCAIL